MTLFDQTRLWLPAMAVLSVIALPAQVQAQAQDQVGPGGGHPLPGRPPGVVRQAPGPGGQPGGQPHVQGPRQGGPMAGQPQAAQPGAPPPRTAVAPQGRLPAPVAQQGRPPGAGPGPGYGQGYGQGHGPGPGPAAMSRGPDARYARGGIAVHDYGGQRYRGRVGWEGGRWRHQVHNGRSGWWWDVGGVWYYYPEPM